MKLIFLRIFLNRLCFNQRGFNLLELLSAASITAVLAVVGIKSYQSQVNKAKTAEAQGSLSYIYSSQRAFYNNWNTYHANLMTVGMIPSGVYNYDVGFTEKGATSGGGLANYPSSLSKSLSVIECSTFSGICSGNCLTQSKAKLGASYSGYFTTGTSCEVIGQQAILDSQGSKCSNCIDAKATASTFKAIATEQLNSFDMWSIDQNQQVKHETDGT